MENKKNSIFSLVISCVALLVAVLIFIGNQTRHVPAGFYADATASSSEPDEYSTLLAYDGPYVDVVAELAKSEPVEAGGLRITKVDADTNLAVPTIKLASGSYEKVLLNMPYGSDTYSLVFENNVLVGYYTPGDSEEEMRTDEETRVALLSEYKNYVEQFVEVGELPDEPAAPVEAALVAETQEAAEQTVAADAAGAAETSVPAQL